jgi:predicted HicB family RNase H-like nuclease
MTYNENKRKYNDKYKQEKMKRIPLDVQKTKYEEIKAAAENANESVNGYIKKAIDMRIQSESK